MWKVEHKKQDGSLLIGYEYRYDLLGRVVQSVERPSGDVTAYTYTPAGRLASEVRTGQVAYSRSYAYNPDGSRAFVMRDDVVNGTHWDFYAYDEVSGRLSVVQDVWTGEVNSFVWNPEGTLARWDASSVAYARVFSYDEEGRLTKIERDYGDGSLQVAYVYGYNGDGIRVWKQDMLAQQEYRYVCRIGCGGVPMRVYSRAMGTTNWNTMEEYLDAPTVRWYGAGAESGQDYAWLAGHWLSGLVPPPSGTMVYEDAFGLRVGGDLGTAAVTNRVPEYLELNPDVPAAYLASGNNQPDWIECLICLAGCRKKGGWELLACISACLAGPCASKPKPKPKPSPSPPPSTDCPAGTCKFVCPGKDPAKEFGCAPPGTTIECPDGTKIPLPKDCGSLPPSHPTPSASNSAAFQCKLLLLSPLGSPCLWVGYSLSF